MVQLIVGNKGKGKTKCLLDKVNTEIKNTSGNICYLDKSGKHMFELNNKIRLINVSDYAIENTDQFLGFIGGILSQDNDLQQLYFDSFLKIAYLDGKDITAAVKKLQAYSDQFKVDMVLSVSLDESELPEEIRPLTVISL